MSERRNAVPLNTIEACLGVIEARGVTIATLTRERDEARAEVERIAKLIAQATDVYTNKCKASVAMRDDNITHMHQGRLDVLGWLQKKLDHHRDGGTP